MGDMDQEELYGFYGENLGRKASASKPLGEFFGVFSWLDDHLLLLLTSAVEVDFDSSPPKDKLKLNFDKCPYVKFGRLGIIGIGKGPEIPSSIFSKPDGYSFVI